MKSIFTGEFDTVFSHTFREDGVDIETIDKLGIKYTIGLLPNGYHCIKNITFEPGYGYTIEDVNHCINSIDETERLFEELYNHRAVQD